MPEPTNMTSSDSDIEFTNALEQAATMLHRGNPRRAAEIAAHVLMQKPQNAEAHFVLGTAAMALGKNDDAHKHLNAAVKLEPSNAKYATYLANAHMQSFRPGEALRMANIADCLGTKDPLILRLLGMIYGQCNVHERAVSVFRRALSLAPADAINRFNYAVALTFMGNLDLAEKELASSLERLPDNWLGYGIRSRLRQQTDSTNHIDQLTELLQKTHGNPVAQIQLSFALGKEHEDMGFYEKAFDHYLRGNKHARALRSYSVHDDEMLVNSLIEAFPKHTSVSMAGLFSEEPIFIVGMPRSGTTLVERILSSHPEVYAAGELQNFSLALAGIQGSPLTAMAPAMTKSVAGLNWHELGTRYLASTRPLTVAKPRFVDKFPQNFFFIGFIANALPNAKIICLRRDPMDTCLSNFREPFSELSPFHGYAFDLQSIGNYYLLFDRLMAHWKDVFPGRILEMSYEDLVAAPDKGCSELLEYCDLPWNEACLHFERNSTPAATASATQVRSPVYRSAVQRWKKYGSRLDDLKSILQSGGISIPD